MSVRKYISLYLKYPFMWVMLLWALTLPGQEVAVYKFLINTITGKTGQACTQIQNGFHKSGDLQKQAVQVFLDAETAAARTLLQQPAKYVLPSFSFTFPLEDNSLSLYPKLFDWSDWVLLFLPVSLLPNAP